MPLALFLEEFPSRQSVLSVGVLDRITREIFGDDVEVFDDEKSFNEIKFKQIRKKYASKFPYRYLGPNMRERLIQKSVARELMRHEFGQVRFLRGYDSPSHYNNDALSTFRDIVRARLAGKLAQCRRHVQPAEVLLIERKQPPGFYKQVGRRAGSERRSIPNINDLHKRLAERHDVTLLDLENRNLAEQVTLFGEARVVVAQHGAALTNMVWMQPGTLIVEVSPAAKMPLAYPKEYFKRLADCLNIRHRYVYQDDKHASLTDDQMQLVDTIVEENKGVSA